MGRFHMVLVLQDRFLINGVDVKIRLVRSKDAFALMAGCTNPAYKIQIVNATLFAKKATLSPTVQMAHGQVSDAFRRLQNLFHPAWSLWQPVHREPFRCGAPGDHQRPRVSRVRVRAGNRQESKHHLRLLDGHYTDSHAPSERSAYQVDLSLCRTQRRIANDDRCFPGRFREQHRRRRRTLDSAVLGR